MLQKRIYKYKINANLGAAYSTSEPMTLLLLWLLGYHSTQCAVVLFKLIPSSIATSSLDQSTVNMKGPFALLFAACISFAATEAAPSSKLYEKASEDK